MGGRWVLSMHALERCKEMDLDRDDVLKVIHQPEIEYPSTGKHAEKNARVAIRDNLAVVIDREKLTVITVLWHGREGRDDKTEEVRS